MQTAVNNKATLLQCLSSHRQQIKSFGVKELGLFGSFVRNTANTNSDIDLLVEFEPDKKSYDNFMELAFYLEDLLGRNVELVTSQSLSKYIGPHILKEVENVSL
ncbi:MAG TPA: nucleotidyltransferase family protein [Chitinophaga sp.]|jgi:predicted nucleotidyltransferase|uniref:nucleotidyltransferase family protein n=1 Tax=Chitinophaga sp. TaxID=1869181 RepID=UPI002DBBBFDB|nr:nucleotidyltransferase family protein [Chitinophaga sp.]HEU4553663.1 nucleotidyltransferase family protein [Chitinophaga sp.]